MGQKEIYGPRLRYPVSRYPTMSLHSFQRLESYNKFDTISFRDWTIQCNWNIVAFIVFYRNGMFHDNIAEARLPASWAKVDDTTTTTLLLPRMATSMALEPQLPVSVASCLGTPMTKGSLYGTASGVSMADRWRAIHSDRVRGEMNSTVGGFLKKKMTWLKVREVGVGEDFSKSPREKWDVCATLDSKWKSRIECVLCAPTVLSTIYILLVYQSKKLVWPWDSWNNHVSWRPSSSV